MSDTARALEIAGEAQTLAEALDQWELERQAMGELFDENQALTISFRQYDLSIDLAERIVTAIEKDAGMFITQGTRDKITQFRKQIEDLAKRRAADRQNVTDANERRSNVKAQ